MLDELKQDIILFIEEETNRIQYGKLYIEMNVVEGKIVDMDVDTKRKKKFNYKKLDKIMHT